MSDDKTPTELNRVTAEKGREEAEDLREEADHERGNAEEHRAVAESSRTEAEQFRVLADEARPLREEYREQMESIRQEREALRHAASNQIEALQVELRFFLRGAAVGTARMVAPMHITLTVVTHSPDTPPKGRRARLAPLAASLLIDGGPRDLLFDQTNRVLTHVALEALQVCPGCGKAFVKVTQKRFCSTRCQSRIYMREMRAKERAEREAFALKETRHGKKTRQR